MVTINLFLNSCNKYFTKFPGYVGKSKKIKNLQNLPNIKIADSVLLQIVSLSMVDRHMPQKGGYFWIPRVPVVNKFGNRNYTLIDGYIKKWISTSNAPIVYNSSGRNDSIYKSIFTDSFKTNYSHLMMQSIDFSIVKQDGIYLVVTYILNNWGGFGGGGASGGGGAGFRSNTLYEFFHLKNDQVIGYNGYSLGRHDSFRNVSKKGYPKYKDVEKVLKWLISDAKK